MDMKKSQTVEFAPGCFDSFEGTQEELDELIAEIQRLADTGELFENSIELDLDELSDEDVDALTTFKNQTIRVIQ
jgi:transcription antitermination factor NusG